MTIDLRIGSKASSRPLRAFAHSSLTRKLWPYTPSIHHARLRLSDINGPRGGKDKECQICLDMGRNGAVVVTHHGFDWDEAVTGAVLSARVAVGRRLDRVRERRESNRRYHRSAGRCAAAEVSQLKQDTLAE